MRIYIDGQLEGVSNTSGSLQLDDWPFWIGSANGNSFFNGSIDNVRVWNTALTQQEIQEYMSCPPTGTEAGLVGYWNFEEGSGTTAYDQTLNGNNGTINGATYSTNVPSQSCNLTNTNGCDSTAVLN